MGKPIYTRTGDKGKTSLFDGKRVLKSDRKVEAYGTIDELNSVIGFVIAEISNKQKRKGLSLITDELERIQNDLFEIGSSLAVSKTLPVDQLESRPKEFEILIDKLTKQLPPLSQFILPGGGKSGALLHVARTVARRAERNIVQLSQKEHIDQAIIIYLNRLSDLLFTMSRFVNYKEKNKEKIWKKR
jgi:cob(I)alamin adenosyltransferase